VEAGVSSIEWGVRLVHTPETGKQRVQEYYLDDQEAAAREYQDLLEMNAERWEVQFGFRTTEVKAGAFTEYKALRSEPAQPEEDPEVLADILSLVGGVMIPAEVISTWTVTERARAARWAAAEHLHASDNEDVQRVPEPGFVKRAAEICASPAMAQLAVENWTAWLAGVQESAEGAGPRTTEAVSIARDAITGLLVLLKDRQPS
jgi:hypothetical protein